MAERKPASFAGVYAACWKRIAADAEKRARRTLKISISLMLAGYFLACGMLLLGCIGAKDFRIIRDISLAWPLVFGIAIAKQIRKSAEMPSKKTIRTETNALMCLIAITDRGAQESFCRLGYAILGQDVPDIQTALRDLESMPHLERLPFFLLVRRAFSGI